MDTMNIRVLRERIVRQWPFDAAHYPRIEDLDEIGRMKFMADHIARHLQHECGALARFLEQLDHRENLAEGLCGYEASERVLPIIRDLLVGTLRLADTLGIHQQRLEDAFEEYLEKSVTLVIRERS